MYLAAIFTILSTIYSIYASVVQAQQQRAQLESQARISEYNASVARTQADYARQAAAAQAVTQRLAAERVMGAQRARYGASGVDVGAGTPLLVQGETIEQGELDAARELWTGENRAQGYLAEANLRQYYATVSRSQKPSLLGAAIGGLFSSAGGAMKTFGRGGGGGEGSSLMTE